VVILKAPAPEDIKIGNQELALHLPDFDPVLDSLGADDPLEALHKAAQIQGFAVEVRL
jgi:CRISPR-associated protein Cmr1